ncbi:TonB-dependent receptor [Compostibacter hankyongensis]|uniref:TonB-dependent receptor n=1 Tax=Compostibacter hankyongensis TaxID=1007089 RepID=A0ABP8FJV7_9BACT
MKKSEFGQPLRGRALIPKLFLFMKISIPLLLIPFLQISAHSYSQERFTLQFEKVDAGKVFTRMQKQSSYRFFYLKEDIQKLGKVSLNVRDATLPEIMQTMLHQQLSYKIVGDNMVVISPQDRLDDQHEVSGLITDTEGNPLPGVTVKIKGQQLGIVTDERGEFRLVVPDDAILEVSYIGYAPLEIPVNGRKQIRIRLKPAKSGLNEVIVVGYGTQRKGEVTSAVSQVSGDDIRATPATALQNALSGKLPGLFTQQRSGQPGAGSAAGIYIRGIATFTSASKEPLVLVDDVEYTLNQLFLIDANEVESVSILKDAAATAIYGIKGANGVILVTTRRGKIGKPTIHFKSQLSVQTPVHRLKTLDAYQTALLENEALMNDGLEPKFTDQDLELFRNHQDPYGHPDINWNDVLFKKNALITNNNLDISGGGERVRYFITLGHMWQDGFLRQLPYKGNDPEGGKSAADVNNNYYMKRYKFRSNLDIKATNTLSFQLDIAGTYEEENEPEANAGAMQHIYEMEYLNPYIYPIYNPDGSFGWGNSTWGEPRDYNNIAGHIALGGYRRYMDDFLNVHLSGTQTLDDLTPGLSLKGVASYSVENKATRSLTRGQNFPSYYYNPADDSYTPKDPDIARIFPYSLGYTKSRDGFPRRRINVQGAVNYQRSFGPHNVSGLLLFNQTSDLIMSNPPVNFRGYTFRMGYNFRDRYLLQLSGAYNGSSRFVTQNRYNLFPAVSLGYNLAREPFFKKILPFVDGFKIRGSYGWVGNDDIGLAGDVYLYEDSYVRAGAYSFGETHNNISGIEESAQGNYDVTWETERKADIGLDFSLFEGKLSGSFDYFDNYRYDILTKRNTVPMYFGVTQANLPFVNIGKVANKGYEVDISYRDRIGKVGIDVSGNFSYAKNKILYQDEPPARYPWQKGTGRPIGTALQYVWTGTFYQDQKDIDTSAMPTGSADAIKPGWLKYKDLNGDGIVNVYDMAYVGNPNLPNTNIGLTLGVSYHGFSLSVLLQAALHFDVYTGFDLAVPIDKAVPQPIHLGRWTPETAATATFPALTNNFVGTYMNPNGNPSTFWSVSGDYLRFRSAQLAYQFPASLVKKVGLQSAQVFVNGYDLFTWSKMLKKYQFDPEVKEGSDHFVYPTERIVNFGLDLTF